MIDTLLLIIGSLGLIIGTITDFQRREVADYVNYFLLCSGLGIRLMQSSISGDWAYVGFGVIWAALAYAFGYFMYVTGQWGGGDAKMITGLGALFGTTQFPGLQGDVLQSILPITTEYQLFFMPHFIFNSFIIGAMYSIIWIAVLIMLHKRAFTKEFMIQYKKERKTIYLIFGAVLLISSVIVFINISQPIIILGLALLLAVFPLSVLVARSVEKTCMIKHMKIQDLTEGEWIVDDVKIKGKYICGPKDLGITLKAIKKLQKYHKEGLIDTVKVKIGIPFVPAFLIAFIFTYFFGNVIFAIL